jgi:hypothetical protein
MTSARQEQGLKEGRKGDSRQAAPKACHVESHSIAAFFSTQRHFLPLKARLHVAAETGLTEKLAVPGLSCSPEGAPLGW